MPILTSIFAFILGTVVGSFLNVVSLRLYTGKGVRGRSACMSCRTVLRWFELVPLWSFFSQRGVCRTCATKISWQYPLVEFVSGALFVLIFFVFPPTTPLAAFVTGVHILALCFLVIITVYDIKHKIIPDSYVYAFGILALVSLFVGGSSWWHIPGYEQLIAGPLLACPFAFLWVVSRGDWMGLGDAKLALGIGWFLGIEGGINAVILAFWIGALVSVVWLLVKFGRFKSKTEIPFGPYLVIGMYLVLIFGIKVIDVGLVRSVVGW